MPGKQFKIEGARLIFRNFAGDQKRFNEAGDRNFCVVLEEDLAGQLSEDGWNVKVLEPREEGDAATPYIKVKVNFSNRPPKIFLMTSSSRTQLNEGSVEQLDYADIKNVDLIVNGFDYSIPGGKSGTSAYLQTLFVLIDEDELERKYGIHQTPDTNDGTAGDDEEPF